jgi:2-C-methyl-D-erythritol 4-phosphate cytidylyltransferase
MKSAIKRYGIKKVIDVIAGGKMRSDSVRSCLERAGLSFDTILIHDGARPFVGRKMIMDSVEAARKFGASLAVVPESDTVKSSRDLKFVGKTLDRKHIFRAQTPQTFKASILRKVYSSGAASDFTDDASLVEAMGYKVKMVEGSYRNIKITTREDLRIGEALLPRRDNR